MTRGSEASRRRRPFQFKQVSVLTLVWVVLVGRMDIVTVAGGFALACLVTWAFPLPVIDYTGRLRPWGVVVLVAALLRDLATASVQLAGYALGRRRPRPGIIRVDLRSDSDLYQVQVAELTSVVPGTIVVDARRRTRTLYLHVFDLPDAADAGRDVADTLAVERRVLRAFGSRAEIEGLAEAERTGETFDQRRRREEGGR